MPNRIRAKQFFVATLATGFAWANGIVLGWSSPLERPAKAGDLGFSVNHEEFSWVGSSLALGAVFSCIPAGLLMDAIGRRLSAILLVIPYCIGWATIIFASHIWMLITGRVVLGIAAGGTCIIIPMYVGEISQKEIRGTLNSLFQLQIVLGILFVYFVGAFAVPLWINIACSIVPIIFAFAMIFLPETPLYLMKKGKEEQSGNSFRWLRGKDYDIKPEMDDIQEYIGQSKQGSIIASFKYNVFRKALYIAVLLMIFQQVSGINAVIFYTTEIFRLAGSQMEPKYSTIVVGVVQLVATIVSTLCVDRFGRRILLMISTMTMVISTLGLGIYFYEQSKDPLGVKDIGWFPLVALSFYIVAYSIGYGPVPWVMIAELFPSESKAIGGGLAVLTNWLFSFIVAKTYPSLKNAIGGGQTFWLFSIFSIMGVVFILFLVPETKKKSFVEIQEILKDRE